MCITATTRGYLELVFTFSTLAIVMKNRRHYPCSSVVLHAFSIEETGINKNFIGIQLLYSFGGKKDIRILRRLKYSTKASSYDAQILGLFFATGAHIEVAQAVIVGGKQAIRMDCLENDHGFGCSHIHFILITSPSMVRIYLTVPLALPYTLNADSNRSAVVDGRE